MLAGCRIVVEMGEDPARYVSRRRRLLSCALEDEAVRGEWDGWVDMLGEAEGRAAGLGVLLWLN